MTSHGKPTGNNSTLQMKVKKDFSWARAKIWLHWFGVKISNITTNITETSSV